MMADATGTYSYSYYFGGLFYIGISVIFAIVYFVSMKKDNTRSCGANEMVVKEESTGLITCVKPTENI